MTTEKKKGRWPSGSAVAIDMFDGGIVEVCEQCSSDGFMCSQPFHPAAVFDEPARWLGLVPLVDLKPLTKLARELLRTARKRR